MIERATQCLHRVGKNAVASYDPGRSAGRSLHSLFWTHGASDIALPAWWNAFLQQPDAHPRRTNHILYIPPQTLRSSILDFLYPPKALEHAARVAARAARRNSSTRQRSIGTDGRQGRRKGLSRWYTTDRPALGQQSSTSAGKLVGTDIKDIKPIAKKEDTDILAAQADILFERLHLLGVGSKERDQQQKAKKKNAFEDTPGLLDSFDEPQILRTHKTFSEEGFLTSAEHKGSETASTRYEACKTSSEGSMASAKSMASDDASSSVIDNVIHEAVAIIEATGSETHLDREARLKFWRGQSIELADAYDAYLKAIDTTSAIPQAEDDFLSAFNFEAPVIKWQLKSTIQSGLAFLTLFMQHFYSRILPSDETLWTDEQWSFLARATMFYPKEGIEQSKPLVFVGTKFPVSIKGVFSLLNKAFAAGHGLEPARGVLKMALQRGQIHFLNALFQFCNRKGLTPSELLAGLATVDTPSLAEQILGCVKTIEEALLPHRRNNLHLLTRRNRNAYLDVIYQLFSQLLQRSLSSESTIATYEKIWTLLLDNKRLIVEDVSQLMEQLANYCASNAANMSAFAHFAYKVFIAANQQLDFVWSQQQIQTLLQEMINIHHPHCLTIFKYYQSKFGYDSKVYKSMLSELSYSGEAEEWQKVYEEVDSRERLDKFGWVHQLLEAYSRRADTATCKSLLESYCREAGHTLDIRSWNAVLYSYVQGSDMVGALNFHKHLEQQGVVPDNNTNMILLRGFASRGESTFALQQVKQIQSRGHEFTMEMVEHLMHSHIRGGDIDRAEQLLYNSVRTNVVGSSTGAWNRVLEAFAKMGRLADLNYLRDNMNRYGVQADVSTYGIIMLGFCMAGLPYQASRILSTIIPLNNMVATIWHYNILIDGFVRKEMFYQAIQIYERLEKDHVKPNAITRNLVTQAISSFYGDSKKGDKEWHRVQRQALKNAEEFLHKSLAEDDDYHASSPLGKIGISGVPLDRAYTTLHFGFLIQQYAQLGDEARMHDLLRQYRLFYSKEYPNQALVDPPKILAAVGQYYLKTGESNKINQLWNTALQSLKPLVMATEADSTKPGWVLWAHSLMIAPIFRVRMIDLMRHKQYQELEELIQSLIRDGWRFPESIWNTYVRFLAREGHYRLALKYCEEYLIEGFPGWPNVRKHSENPKKFIEKHTPGSLYTGIMKPTYEVLCWLARRYIDFQQKHAYSPQRVELDSELWNIAPLTLKAVTTMPRVPDITQGKILRGE